MQQVIQMLTNMKVKGQEMMESEKKIFEKYGKWARNQSRVLGSDIASATQKIEELTAFADKADSDVAELGRRIEDLDAEIDELSSQKKAATEDRKSQHQEYLQVSTDLAESVDALERAIQTLSAQNYDRAQAEALLQELAKTTPGMPRVLAAFTQERRALRGDGSGAGAPAVAAYEFQSSGVLTLLKKLLDEFREQSGETEKEEMNAAHAFSMTELHLSDTIAADQADREEKAALKGKRAAESAEAKSELAETKAGKAASEKLKTETETTYEVKSKVFEENQKVRTGELEALDKAVEILSSPEASGNYAKRIAELQAARPPASFLQLGRSRRRMSSSDRVAELLRARAKMLHSKTLADVAAQIAESPFTKVIDMIETLLEKLKEEAANEAEHKAWCDKELKANKLKRNKKTAQANELQAVIEGLGPKIAEMAAAIESLSAEQAELTKAIADATKIRQEEKAENTAIIADAKAGAAAVKKAHIVIEEFYASQGALLQQHQVPEMEAYKGMQRTSGGVVGMLEVIAADFARLKSETEAAEAGAASEYDSFMAESEATIKQKHDAEFKMQLDKDQAEFEKSTAEKDLASVSAELAKANAYFEELKPSCIEVHVSFEERSAQRQEEIEALKEAYRILDQKSAA